MVVTLPQLRLDVPANFVDTETPVKSTPAKPQTILHVTECSGGGVPRAIETAIKATPGLRHVVLASPGAVRTDEIGAEFIELPEHFSARVRAVGEAAAAVDADVVHAHSSWGGVYARLANLDMPLLYEPHCYAFSDVTKSAGMRAVFWLAERALTPRTDAVLALTPYEESQARRLGVDTVHQIINAPTLSRDEIESPIEREKPDQFQIVMSGRISPQKDPGFFADVAKEFADDDSVRFVWMGDIGTGGYRVADDSHKLAEAGVEITGWLEDSAAKALLANTDIYLHTAAFEGFPLSLLDACELAIPSIVRDIPSLNESGLPKFATPAQAADLIRTLISDPAALGQTKTKSRQLADSMNRAAHDGSLVSAYSQHLPIAVQSGS